MCSFDPTYKLGPNERASSILDWEARHLQLAAKSNSLTIVNADVVGCAKCDWYSTKLVDIDDLL